MSNAIDEAFGRLQGIEAEILGALQSGSNEADTRFKALDQILLEVIIGRANGVLADCIRNR